jgi:hypothetical protein
VLLRVVLAVVEVLARNVEGATLTDRRVAGVRRPAGVLVRDLVVAELRREAVAVDTLLGQ